jgi:hypothetical protein
MDVMERMKRTEGLIDRSDQEGVYRCESGMESVKVSDWFGKVRK